MTEYGRGQGSEPWHPEDPLYGDLGWRGQADDGRSPYGGRPQQQYPQQPQYGDPQGQYPGQQGPYPGQQAPPYQGRQAQQYPGQQQNQQYNGGWETGQNPAAVPYGAGAADPYTQQPGGYPGETPDLYGTPDAYPPPQPPGRRPHMPEQSPESQPNEPDEPEHAFFAGGDGRDDDGEYDDDPRERRRGRGGGERRGKSKPKRRNGCACLMVAVVLVGGFGGVSYYGYQFWQDRFGPAEDFAGEGRGQVEVEIPSGASGTDIGNILKQKGVVKSVGAFVAAQTGHPDGKLIQPGVYTLKKEMSAGAAVALMIDPASRSGLIIREGMRNVQVYAAIDKQLGLKAGTTKGVATSQVKNLGLPSWADDNSKIKDPLEGFLFPSRYDVGKSTKPEKVLQQMVARANEKYGALNLEAKATALGLDSPLQVITVASLVQAEGMTHDDFKKMSAVVYNRLKPANTVTNRKLEFDSSFNYLKNQSKINISIEEIRGHDDPYNTYFYKGLTPGPIGNPGEDALTAALAPDKGGWMFFVSVDGQTTKFTKTLAEHEKLVDQFNERQKNGD
ncbi:endolytic transglycosylase MltG [Streptomyces sp. A3M-1-3]|uniref:endolytic transglycosylase MltG n=1 Tax=Streptomyces sp. A3M-1-3 TaxID=2962044 RepID=UPI0020B82D6F|nr:endolytic transglycosylase MltG [Streptomyces sp. A3M-1-3]MCP3817053.1 endolytic transglycosylase MltG [Streptomyces sp. A3M-1-3]